MADIDRINFSRAALEQAISEPSGRGADVHRNLIAYIDSEKVEGTFQFQSATADKTRRRRGRNHCVRVNQQRWLLRDLLADADLTSHDRALCLLAARIKRAFHQNLIKPDFFHDLATSEGLAAASPGRAEARPFGLIFSVALVNAETERSSCSSVVQSGGINTIVSRIFLVSKP